MARTKMEEKEIPDVNLDINEEIPLKEVYTSTQTNTILKESLKEDNTGKKVPVSCLRNERVIVRFIPKKSGIWGDNPKHILAGGMAEGSTKVFVVPRLTSGMYVNVLTDNEKAYLEEIMGLEYNALSIYKKNDNFWDDGNNKGINSVRLTKQDNYLNLADPEDYIKYKILLANKDYIAPSLQDLQDRPKASYQYVIISADDETKVAKLNMSTTMKCYKEFGKIENDIDILRTVIETIDGRPTSPNSKLEFLQTKANDLIQMDSKLFLRVITDPLLNTKVLIKKGIEQGVISNRGNYLYIREDNTPLCEHGEEPTLNIAAKFLNAPKHQDLLFSLQAKIK